MKTNKIEEILLQHSEALARLETVTANHLQHHKDVETIKSWLIPTIVSTIISVGTIITTYLIK